jgi:hypothetical protein
MVKLLLLFILSALPTVGQTLKAGAPSGQEIEALRAECIEHRRIVCGRVIQALPDGVVVESGYEKLTEPPLNRSWLVPGSAAPGPASPLVEGNRQDCICAGLVFLTDLPKKPVVHLYDYVNLRAYPAGQHTYTSVGEVQRKVRRFSTKLKKAVQWKLDQSQKEKP